MRGPRADSPPVAREYLANAPSRPRSRATVRTSQCPRPAARHPAHCPQPTVISPTTRRPIHFSSNRTVRVLDDADELVAGDAGEARIAAKQLEIGAADAGRAVTRITHSSPTCGSRLYFAGATGSRQRRAQWRARRQCTTARSEDRRGLLPHEGSERGYGSRSPVHSTRRETARAPCRPRSREGDRKDHRSQRLVTRTPLSQMAPQSAARAHPPWPLRSHRRWARAGSVLRNPTARPFHRSSRGRIAAGKRSEPRGRGRHVVHHIVQSRAAPAKAEIARRLVADHGVHRADDLEEHETGQPAPARTRTRG